MGETPRSTLTEENAPAGGTSPGTTVLAARRESAQCSADSQCTSSATKSDKGCPGVCNYKYTLSGKGYPCFSDHSNTDCAWCNKEGWQCERNAITGPDSKKGSRCQARTNQKYCASQQGDCKHIGYCDPNATCKKKANVGKFGQYCSANATRDGLA